MSNTRVSGLIRLNGDDDSMDTLRSNDIPNRFGVPWNNSENDNRYTIIPKGDNQSIQYCFFRNKPIQNITAVYDLKILNTWGVIFIWGDLENFSDQQAIYKYIKDACADESFVFRIICCSILVEVSNKGRYLIFKDESDEIIMKKIENLEVSNPIFEQDCARNIDLS